MRLITSRPGIIFLLLAVTVTAYSQQPRYTAKALVDHIDTAEFKIVHPVNGFDRSYVEANLDLYDVDDDNTTLVMQRGHFILCFEGNVKNKKRYGIFTASLIDSANHNIKYKLYEQQYNGDDIPGDMKIFTLKGTLYSVLHYNSTKVKTSEKYYWIDGKALTSEKDYLGSEDVFIEKYFYKNGKVQTAVQYSNGRKNGAAKAYYETGVLQDSVTFKNDLQNGTRGYFYPTGKIWIEEIYKDGKDWTVVANYTDDGKKRDAGTLKEGNGTIIFYDDDGSVREVKKFVNGIEQP